MSQGYTYLHERLRNSVLGFYSFNDKGRQGIMKLKLQAGPVSLQYLLQSLYLLALFSEELFIDY